jgi:hypothetical protein
MLVAPDEYLERDSKGWSAPVKQAMVVNTKFIICVAVISSIAGATIQILDRKLENDP